MILPAPTPKAVLLTIGALIAIMTVSYIAAMAVAFVHAIP